MLPFLVQQESCEWCGADWEDLCARRWTARCPQYQEQSSECTVHPDSHTYAGGFGEFFVFCSLFRVFLRRDLLHVASVCYQTVIVHWVTNGQVTPQHVCRGPGKCCDSSYDSKNALSLGQESLLLSSSMRCLRFEGFLEVQTLLTDSSSNYPILHRISHRTRSCSHWITRFRST